MDSSNEILQQIISDGIKGLKEISDNASTKINEISGELLKSLRDPYHIYKPPNDEKLTELNLEKEK